MNRPTASEPVEQIRLREELSLERWAIAAGSMFVNFGGTVADPGSQDSAIYTNNTTLTNVGFFCEVLLACITGIFVFLNSMSSAGCAQPNECSYPLGEAAIYVELFGVIAALTATFAIVSMRRETRLTTDFVPFLGVGAIVLIYVVSTVMTTVAYGSLYGDPLYSQ